METNFLRDYVSLFEGTEVPDRFATWAGVSCLSAMLERRIWLDMNIFTIYPNMFVIFVADSGRMRKSTAILMTSRLLGKVDPGPRMIAQKITPEALIDALRVTRTNNPKEILKETCGGIVIADELVSFLNQDTYQRGLGGLLIQLWDCPDFYEYRTRNREPEEIHFGHLSLLGGTTIHTLKDAIPLVAMGDGFSSRVLFIYEDETPHPVPRPIAHPHFRETQERLVLHLQRLADLSGEVTLSADAIELFDREYIDVYHSKLYDDGRLAAYASRRDKHLLKVAMCLMAAEGDSMQISRHDLEGARILLTDIESRFPVVFDRLSMTDTGAMTERVALTIETAQGGEILRSVLLSKFSHQVNALELSRIVDTLVMAERITIDTERGKVVYRATKGKR